MGTDIAGGVEIRPLGAGSPWRFADIEIDLPRHYDAFGLLFGVRNFAGFDPVAPGRGLPDDASAELLALRYASPVHDQSWVLESELAGIDWNAPSPRVDDRIHEYRQTEDGPERVGKAGHHGILWRSMAGEQADPRGSSYPEGTEWRAGDRIFRVERISTADVWRCDPALRDLLSSMSELAGKYGGDNVRLVVWFDS